MSAYYDEFSPPKPTPALRRQTRTSYWPILVFVLLAGLLVWWIQPLRFLSGPPTDPNAAPRPVTARGDLAADEKSTIELYEKNRPGVAYITTLAVERDFSLNLLEVPEGTGSGFVWDEDGHVVTNYHVVQHVIESGGSAKVTLADHNTWKATVVGGSADNDLAVLKIDAPKSRLHPILIGTSKDLKVGQKVFAIGNPFGLDQTLTTGVVSALGREIKSITRRPIRGVIQTDAAINPGNSGGPLLDSAGLLIGVNTAIYSPSGAYAGIGFAIPVDTVNRVAPELIRSGKIVRPGMGIHIAQDQLARQARVESGVLIIDVLPDSPAAKAGLQPTRRDRNGQIQLGDVIVAIDGNKIASADDLYNALEKRQVGDKVRVTVERDDARRDVEIALAGF